MANSHDESLVFGLPVGALIRVGEYFDYSKPALSALCDGRSYECVMVCAVMVDVIVNDILAHWPSNAVKDDLRDRPPVGAIIKELEKRYTNTHEGAILTRLRGPECV